MSATVTSERLAAPATRSAWADRLDRGTALRLALLALAVAAAVMSAVEFTGSKLTLAAFLWLAPAVALFALAARPPAVESAWLLGTATLPRRPALVRVALGLGLTVMLAYVARGVPEPLLVGGWLLAQALWLSAFIPRPRRPAMP